jgi:GxxExxY protein
VSDIFKLCDIIRKECFDIHSYLKHGHLEKVYENALYHRLKNKSLNVEQQYPIEVRDKDGTVLGDFFADLFVKNKLIVELKACSTLVNEHIAQLLGYLRATGIEHGLLINFGNPKLQKKIYSQQRYKRKR